MSRLHKDFVHDPYVELRSQDGSGDVAILYTNIESEVDAWFRGLGNTSTILGFDTEWRPVFVKGQETKLATIQISTAFSAIVIQVNAIPPAMRSQSSVLGRFLMSPGSTLVGMGIREDYNKVVEALLDATPAPRSGPTLVDLKAMSISKGVHTSGGLLGLAQHLEPPTSVSPGVAKWKSKKLQLSNWSRFPLDEPQIRYAAMDAWASLRCYTLLAALPTPTGAGELPVHIPRPATTAPAVASPARPPVVVHSGVVRVVTGGGAAAMPASAVVQLKQSEDRLSLLAFKQELIARFGQGTQYAARDGAWVHAAHIGTHFPRKLWPAGYSNLRKLAQAMGLETRDGDSSGAFFIHCA